MADWRKTQYRIGPKSDPLADVEDYKYVGLAVLIGVLFFGSVGGLIFWLLTL